MQRAREMAQSCTIVNGLHKISGVSPCHAYSSTGVVGSCFRNLNELDSSVNNPTVNRKHQERLTNAVLWWLQEEEHSIPLTYRGRISDWATSHPWWVEFESDRIAVVAR